MRNRISKQLQAYISIFPAEIDFVAPICRQIEDGRDITARLALPGHITASGIVVRNNRLLSIYHPYLNRWLQPGGHIDANEEIPEAAIREVFEETGCKSELHLWHIRNVAPFDIDVHVIPENKKKREPRHLHYDFRYLLKATDFEKSSEKLKAKWISFDDVNERHLSRLIKKLADLEIIN